MNSTNIENVLIKPKGVVKAKLSRDDIIMRGGMIVIALYLVISLVFPLYSMFSKSFSTFQYDLSKFEVQVSDDTGQFPPTIVSLESLNGEFISRKFVYTFSSPSISSTDTVLLRLLLLKADKTRIIKIKSLYLKD